MLVEVVLAVLLLVLIRHLLKKPQGLPPGRWGLPLVGYIPLARKRVEDQLEELHKKHGDVYMWRMGTQNTVFLHNYKIVKEAFTRPEFVGRPDWFLFHYSERPCLGVIGSSGATWRNNRRFSLRQLRDMGMGKSRLVEAVQAQAVMLVNEMKKQAGKPAPVPHALAVAITNVIWQMVGSRHFEVTDFRSKDFQHLLEETFNNENRFIIVDLLPWITKVLPTSIVNWIIRMDIVDEVKGKFFTYFKEVIDDHRETLDRNNPRDLIDGYLIDMEKENDPESTFTEKDLLFLLLDLFAAGSQTTQDSLLFLFYYLAKHPEVQAKMHKEIDEILDGALPTMEDKARMPYTEAVIHEALRKSSLASVGVQHVATEDTTLAGYTIPKGSIMHSMAAFIHHDPRYWNEPDRFMPERWLDQDGRFATKKEGFLPFGVGKRQCLGEGLARMELFIVSVMVLQSLSLDPPPGKAVNASHDPDIPMGHIPIKQDIMVTVRR